MYRGKSYQSIIERIVIIHSIAVWLPVYLRYIRPTGGLLVSSYLSLV